MAESHAKSLVFPASEYKRRVGALQQELAQRGQAALLLTTAADIFYVTGFLTRFWESPARPWFVIVPAAGPVVSVIPEIGAPLMARTSVTEIRTWASPDPDDDGICLLCDTLAALVPANGRIALPMGLETHLRMPLGDFFDLQARLAPRAFVDGTGTIQRVREIKSAAEISKIATTCAIAEAAFAKVPEIVTNAPYLSAVFRNFQSALLEAGADWVSYVAGGAGPDGYHDVIAPAEHRSLRRGDVMMLDTGAVRDGYFCDFDRNFVIGQSSATTERAHAALYDATETALEHLRPGMVAADAHLLLREALLAQGATPGEGRFGHGLGVTLTEWPSFTAKDQTPLRAGMVLTLEPSVRVGRDRILVHEEVIVLRDDGPELLTQRAPAELPVIAL